MNKSLFKEIKEWNGIYFGLNVYVLNKQINGGLFLFLFFFTNKRVYYKHKIPFVKFFITAMPSITL